jgi:hypothetical protein
MKTSRDKDIADEVVRSRRRGHRGRAQRQSRRARTGRAA